MPIENYKIYDKLNNEITNLGTASYSYVPLDEISPNVINAFLSVEDQDYYKHNGINMKRMTKAFFTNLFKGKIVSGASTITQQYVKNTYLTPEKTFDRKAKEIALSLKLEEKYTKDQILESYLNTILFGGNIYGVKMASNYYFRKSPKELSISEAAMLAGMVQLPNYYNPFQRLEETNRRKNLVVELMYEQGYISKKEKNKEQSINLIELLNKGTIIKYDSYVSSYLDYLYSYMKDNFSISQNTKNIEIKSYLNLEIQKFLYDIVSNKNYNFFEDEKLKCAMVVIDNKTMGVAGLIGNSSTDSQVLNYALIPLQPGSTIKPILDYGPAIEYLNYTPATIIVDEPVTYSDGTKIKNWDYQYKGPITLRVALRESRNIPAYKAFMEVGKTRCFEFASKIGIVPIGETFEADSLGGSTYGYTLLDLTNAYASFANLGKYKNATPVKSYKELYTQYQTDENMKSVMKKETAYLINSVLHDVFKGSVFDIKDTYLMAKTGQTNYDAKTREKYGIPESATKDSLLIAYTKDLTLGIWVGYDTVSSTTYLNNITKQIPREIMSIFFNKFALKNQYYEMPDNIVKSKIYQDGSMIYLAKGSEPGAYYEYFKKGTEPLTTNDVPYIGI